MMNSYCVAGGSSSSNNREGERGSLQTTNSIKSLKELELKQKELNERADSLLKAEKELEKQQEQLLIRIKENTQRSLDLDQREQRISDIEEKLSKSTTVTTTRGPPNEMVRLNVGGTIFATTMASLLSEKDTFFSAYFSDYFVPNPEEHDHAYFIDRPNANFELILDHLRGLNIRSKIERLSEKDLMEFVDEVVYYQVTSIFSLLPSMGKNSLRNKYTLELDEEKLRCDTFDPTYTSSGLQLTSNNKRVVKKDHRKNSFIVFGDVCASEYSIKLISNCANLFVGFASRTVNVHSDSLSYDNTGGYYLKMGNGRLFSSNKTNCPYNGEPIKDGSVVKAILKENKISFMVNGKTIGKAYDVPSHNLYPHCLFRTLIVKWRFYLDFCGVFKNNIGKVFRF
ncbi:hypothetical protein C9374_014476 [Naegleria lovaniensis]|uniref:Potassium channel tetramerisation-type BTB domain-containing protein n=1 Tax=Naegleria lovaniensis TaxID=51637 RepID=A0AA88GZW6_NAELO|nr:uncharacterized protein C9374_014476 [Naegleria lovaniensis]KAG2389076.1 hypothetical protein C9374_014476 [Naegleria lovaniensis]